ncbi:polysaccharide pyruvyl transferase family protein [Mycolicibacterium litorale]|uniref:polysaccharide pyruvyl transferase family protein n=1 Tax=Mycolicibacterium litorale TaxID=758802 RepID=UPI0039A1A5C4
MTAAAVPYVGYLGWHGKGNLGDDAIYDAVRSQLPGATFLDLPRFPHEWIRATATGLTKPLRQSAQVVGGGTLIGRRHWRRLITSAAKRTGRGDYAIGVGVEDPVFVGRRSGSGGNELARWVPLLERFDTVSVRGPRSAELLADAGFEVSVSGDPALVLPSPEAKPVDGLIGLNLGFGDDLWGHDPERVVAEVTVAVGELAARGYRFVGVLMNPDDEKWTGRVLAGVSADIVLPADAAAAAAQFAGCSAVVVSRLHAGILASLSGTPVVSLEYQPKCRDFALSIDDERSLLRTDRVTGGELVDRVLQTLADADAIRRRTSTAVDTLRARLHADYARVRENVGIA